MNKCLEKDNIQAFISLFEKKEYDIKTLYYSTIKTNSYNILLYIITELNYIQDYIYLKSFLPKDYLYEVITFLKKYKPNYLNNCLLKLAKKNKIIEFKNMIKDGDIELKYSHIHFLVNNKKIVLIKDIYHNRMLSPSLIIKLFKGIIDNNMENLIDYFISRYNFNTISWSYSIQYTSNDIYIFYIHEYALYKEKYNIFRKITNTCQNKFDIIDKIQYYRNEDLIYIIDNIKLDMDYNIYSLLKLLYDILDIKNKDIKYDISHVVKYFLQQFPDICKKNHSELIKSIDKEDMIWYEKYKLDDVYSIICLQNTPLDLHDYYLEYYEGNLDLLHYIPYIIGIYDTKFLQEYIQKYNITIQEEIQNYKRFTNIFDIFQDKYNYIYYSNSCKNILSNIEYIIDTYNYNIAGDIFVLIIGIQFDSDNQLSEIEYEEQIIEHYDSLLNFIIKYEKMINESIFIKLLTYSIYIEKIKFVEYFLNKCDLSNIVFDDKFILYTVTSNITIFNLIKNAFSPIKYKEFISLCDINIIPRIKCEILETLIKDGINYKDIEYIPINIYYHLEDLIPIIDIWLKYGYNNISKYLISYYEHSKSDSISGESIKPYLKYFDKSNIDDIFNIACKIKDYDFIIYITTTYNIKITCKLIKKYKLDYTKINWDKDIEGQLTCAVCYSNSPCVIFLSCGHLLCCIECFRKMNDKCPFDNITYDKTIILKGISEKERYNCHKCKKNKIEYAYPCGHCVCKKCCFKTKCSVCSKTSKYVKIYLS